MNFHLRPAQENDIKTLVRLVNSVYRGEEAKKSWTTEADLLEGLRIDESTLQALIQNPNHTILVLENHESGALLGCVELEKSEPGVYRLGLLSVVASEQRSGLGTHLLTSAESYARKELHAQKIEMSVVSVRKELLDWYFRRGYKLNGKSYPFSGEATRLSSFKKEPLFFVVLEKIFDHL
jgi:N-acetylglutamate synthase-like GNAT family acetyltransferase